MGDIESLMKLHGSALNAALLSEYYRLFGLDKEFYDLKIKYL